MSETNLTEQERQSFREYALKNMTETDGTKSQWADYTVRLLDELEALKEKLPWCWDYQGGQWVKVSVVPGMHLWRSGHWSSACAQDGESPEWIPPSQMLQVSNRMIWAGAQGSKYGSGPWDVNRFYATEAAAQAAGKEGVE